MKVDSFKYLPSLVTRYYKMSRVTSELPIPWTPLARPLDQARFSLITSGGLYHEGHEPPFDVEGERRKPDWGDPSYRTLPADMDPDDVRVSHLHLNPADIEADMNILLPIQRFQELVAAGRIGSLAGRTYSFMGYQGFPADQQPWKEVYGPEVAGKLLADQVDCVLLTAAWPECAANVPVLARLFEAAGLSTILVTNMPFWAERVGAPRTLAVEFPFGHILGRPDDRELQMRVIEHALEVLETADSPGTLAHFQEVWPEAIDEALHRCHPEQPLPIMGQMGRHIGSFLRGLRRGGR